MAGTILKQLTATAQTNGTAQTFGPGNSGWSSATPGSGNTAIHADAAKMGQVAGYRMTQAGANTNIAYLDLTTPVTIYALRIPFKFSATPSTNVVIGRLYPDNTHATNLGSFTLTTSSRLQFVEGGAGTPLNVTSTGTTLTAGSSYVMQVLINCTTNAFEARVYPLGSTTQVFSISGTLGADMAAAASIGGFRWSIGTASALMGGSLDTNSAFAAGQDDWLVRHDVSNVAPTANAGVDQIVLPGQTFTVNGSGSTDSDGTIVTYTWAQTAGTALALSGSGASRTATAPYATTDQVYTYGLTVTDDQGADSTQDTMTVTVPAHPEWYLHSSGTWKARTRTWL